jgi:hypothetical protein
MGTIRDTEHCIAGPIEANVGVVKRPATRSRDGARDGHGRAASSEDARVSAPAEIYAVVIRFDSAGASALIIRQDSEPLPGGDGVRYRLITETDDRAYALRVAYELERKCRAGDIRRR